MRRHDELFLPNQNSCLCTRSGELCIFLLGSDSKCIYLNKECKLDAMFIVLLKEYILSTEA